MSASEALNGTQRGEGVCPCTSLAVCVLQLVALYTVHMSIASEVCNTVYTTSIYYTSLYTRVREGVCCRGVIRYLETQNGSSEGGVMNK